MNDAKNLRFEEFLLKNPRISFPKRIKNKAVMGNNSSLESGNFYLNLDVCDNLEENVICLLII